ncbi:hypothetical protein DBV05_g10990 [Lasiodiplodia theobromae]|uniref:Uncharacterized protein n=1 Tax=Lasiodiplodia theobromae TaxID=45133 RepID=A0A5N5CYD9_9PEZI|nr:hypothetical protein DBV05_g10990 [Lasiodiplodia theobromae]
MMANHFKTSIFIAESDLAPKVNRDFGLVNGKNFGKLMDTMGHHYDAELLEMIIQNSEPLHGRVVWSVCYLDEVKKLIDSQRSEQKKVLSNQLKEVSVRICEMAKRGLKERLEDMRRTTLVDGSVPLDLQLTDLEIKNILQTGQRTRRVRLTALKNQVTSLDNLVTSLNNLASDLQNQAPGLKNHFLGQIDQNKYCIPRRRTSDISVKN